MSTLHFWIFGREFRATCDDGQEARLKALIDRLKERVEALTAATPAVKRDVHTQMQALVLSAITFADEFQDARDALRRLQHELRPASPPTEHASGAALAALATSHTAIEQRLQALEARLATLATLLET